MRFLQLLKCILLVLPRIFLLNVVLLMSFLQSVIKLGKSCLKAVSFMQDFFFTAFVKRTQ